jgi:hypothetical protein
MKDRIDIPRFHEGQKVVCVNTIGTQGIKHMAHYVVVKNFYCTCGVNLIDVGVGQYDSRIHGTQCDCGRCHDFIYVYKPSRFVPLQEQTAPLLTFEKINESEKVKEREEQEILILN